jgi:hypothetical protein
MEEVQLALAKHLGLGLGLDLGLDLGLEQLPAEVVMKVLPPYYPTRNKTNQFQSKKLAMNSLHIFLLAVKSVFQPFEEGLCWWAVSFIARFSPGSVE